MKRGVGGDEKDFVWRLSEPWKKLPVLKWKQLKLGPAFGFGAGCGFGFGVGLIGGMGVGPGIPGLQIGFGLGAGCGVGLGYGYGMGKGIAYDGNRKYSNVGSQDEIGALIDELVINTNKLIKATSRNVDKWRRF
ncbi:Forkhead box protein [Actinidia chinensis var. chinensis]|uniref:Forkhead box protein n=1 Tax=Actinidia chinensis var. chinensis TaxID=1590841 RepID=A0A2R6Q1C0_ACTCC|nr:Forkhead box protein [Actinidia chinensis var. chinensis]